MGVRVRVEGSVRRGGDGRHTTRDQAGGSESGANDVQ